MTVNDMDVARSSRANLSCFTYDPAYGQTDATSGLAPVSRVRIGYPNPIRLASARGMAGGDGCRTTPVWSRSTQASG